MKRFFALLVSLLFAFALTSVAFAEEGATSTPAPTVEKKAETTEAAPVKKVTKKKRKKAAHKKAAKKKVKRTKKAEPKKEEAPAPAAPAAPEQK